MGFLYLGGFIVSCTTFLKIQYCNDSRSCIRKWIYLKLAYEASFVSFNAALNSCMTCNEDFCPMFLQTRY